MKKVEEGAGGATRRRADRLCSDTLFVAPGYDTSTAPFSREGLEF